MSGKNHNTSPLSWSKRSAFPGSLTLSIAGMEVMHAIRKGQLATIKAKSPNTRTTALCFGCLSNPQCSSFLVSFQKIATQPRRAPSLPENRRPRPGVMCTLIDHFGDFFSRWSPPTLGRGTRPLACGSLNAAATTRCVSSGRAIQVLCDSKRIVYKPSVASVVLSSTCQPAFRGYHHRTWG